MNRPAASEILKNDESCYSLVIAVAKRAREIAINSEATATVLDKKTVQIAVEEFYVGKCRLIESNEVYI